MIKLNCVEDVVPDEEKQEGPSEDVQSPTEAADEEVPGEGGEVAAGEESKFFQAFI